jgi:hypothetical protein
VRGLGWRSIATSLWGSILEMPNHEISILRIVDNYADSSYLYWFIFYLLPDTCMPGVVLCSLGLVMFNEIKIKTGVEA